MNESVLVLLCSERGDTALKGGFPRRHRGRYFLAEGAVRIVWLVMVADADARGEVLGSVASRKAVICVYLQPTRLPRGGSAMTADDDLPAQRSVLRLSVATAGVAWYVILFSIGLIGCWNAYVHVIYLLYSCSLTPLS